MKTLTHSYLVDFHTDYVANESQLYTFPEMKTLTHSYLVDLQTEHVANDSQLFTFPEMKTLTYSYTFDDLYTVLTPWAHRGVNRHPVSTMLKDTMM